MQRSCAEIVHGAFDFIFTLAELARQNTPQDNGTFRTSFDGTGGFFKVQGDDILYNLHDAGNFLTGKAFSLCGVNLEYLLAGANLNEIFTHIDTDSKADERAISNGYIYSRVVWQSELNKKK